MSIDNKLTYLQQTKEKIKTAIQNKGVNVSDADTFRSYAEKISLIEGGGSGGDTTWAYHTGQAVAGDKVMLTKVNSLVTPDDAFCNGFRPYLIMNGYAYGVVGDATSADYNARRQIVNGVISSSDSVSVAANSVLSWKTNIVPFYTLNGSACVEAVLQSPFGKFNNLSILSDTTKYTPTTANQRAFICDNAIMYTTTSGNCKLYDYSTKTEVSIPRLNPQSFCFEDGSGENFYGVGFYTTTPILYKYNKTTGATEQLATPTVRIETSADITSNYTLFIQTKDNKYLLNGNAYIELDISDNTYTIKDYPAVIKNAMGDRTLYCMQVFYDGCFSIQLSDGTTLICKYTNSMEDVEIKEIVEPIYIDGDPTVYQRSFSPDRMYWFNRPLYTNKVVAVPLASNPAGAYNKQNAKSDYVAFPPSKDRFNSTVLTGFLTGETEPDAEGRQMAEVKTALGI